MRIVIRVLVAAALLLASVVAGIFTTMVDVLCFQEPCFLTHVTLLVLLNALIATHVDVRRSAMLVSVPINLGFVEGYYIATSASYEGFARSLMLPLASLALIAPLLVFGLWSVRRSRDAYGVTLALVTGAASVGLSFAVNHAVGVYDVVCALLTVLVLTVLPARKLRLAPTTAPAREALVPDIALDEEPERPAEITPEAEYVHMERDEQREPKEPKERERSKKKPRHFLASLGRKRDGGDQEARETGRTRERTREREVAEVVEAEEEAPVRRSPAPTRRRERGRTSSRSRSFTRRQREELEQEEREREARRQAAGERRQQRREETSERERPVTLGNARVATKSARRSYR